MPVKDTLSVTVRPPPIHYEMVFGDNLLEQAFAFAKSHSLRPFLVTTTAIQGLLPQIKEDKIVLPQGESIKSRAMKEKIEEALIERGCGRETCLIAVGGGAPSRSSWLYSFNLLSWNSLCFYSFHFDCDDRCLDWGENRGKC